MEQLETDGDMVPAADQLYIHNDKQVRLQAADQLYIHNDKQVRLQIRSSTRSSAIRLHRWGEG